MSYQKASDNVRNPTKSPLIAKQEVRTPSPYASSGASPIASPIRRKKRGYQAISSPGTCGRYSPNSKYLYNPSKSPKSCFVSFSFPTTSESSNVKKAAVPRVALEPPSPSQLPKPPVHWKHDLDHEKQKQQCRVYTESLVTHLATTGILVSSQ